MDIKTLLLSPSMLTYADALLDTPYLPMPSCDSAGCSCRVYTQGMIKADSWIFVKVAADRPPPLAPPPPVLSLVTRATQPIIHLYIYVYMYIYIYIYIHTYIHI